MRHQELIFNLTGQTFYYDPPEGRPSGTPTVEVFDSGDDDESGAVSATTGAASVDSVSTTLSVAASLGDTTLTVTSGTGIVRGRRYLLTDSNGEREWIEVSNVNGTAVAVRHPLVNDYDSGATFQGCRISIALSAAFVADTSRITDVLASEWRKPDDYYAAGSTGYRLRWAYTVDGTATIGVSYADLVRYQAKNLVSPLDVDRLFPGWIDRLPPDYREDQGVALIEEAFNAVKMDAMADAHVLRRVRDTQVLSELVKYRANLLMVQNSVVHNGVDQTALVIAEKLYDQRYNTLIREPKVSVDNTGGGSAGEAVRLPAWRR